MNLNYLKDEQTKFLLQLFQKYEKNVKWDLRKIYRF